MEEAGDACFCVQLHTHSSSLHITLERHSGDNALPYNSCVVSPNPQQSTLQKGTRSDLSHALALCLLTGNKECIWWSLSTALLCQQSGWRVHTSLTLVHQLSHPLQGRPLHPYVSKSGNSRRAAATRARLPCLFLFEDLWTTALKEMSCKLLGGKEADVLAKCSSFTVKELGMYFISPRNARP